MQLTNIVVALAASFALPAQAQSPVAPAKTEGSVVAWPFDLTQVQLTPSRWMDNQNRSLAYLHFVDVNRMLYVFRNNHGLSTQGAATNGGWDAPSFPFRSHVQGHLMSAWAQCYATTKDATCLSKAQTMTAELAKCQANNAKAGFKTGYLSGFPESEFDKLEKGQLTNGNVPYYCIHKTMAGLLDLWRWTGDANAKSVLLNLAGWVDSRTASLSSSQMQSVLGTEFGGMGEVLTDLYFQSGDSKWLTTAARFFHNSVINPLASNQDQLNGLHANTNMPKFIHALRDYKATGTSRSKDIGSNAWNIIQNTRIFAIGSTDEAEHFHGANQISAYLKSDSAETCPTYNYLKLTREMYAMNPKVSYFDYYEKGLINLILGQQRPSDSHGALTYFNSMNAGGRRGLGPAWGGGTWSTDYNSFWCCMGSGLESHTKLYDSIYWYDSAGLYVNLFTPSVLQYTQMGVTVTQSTNFPVEPTTTLTIGGGVDGCAEPWTMRIRIPGWVAGTPTITVNGQAVTAASAGNYASITRNWAPGDVVKVTLPMGFRLAPANDNKALAAVAYGPVVLVGNYGSQTVSSAPTLQLSTLKRTSTSTLAFSGTANGQSVTLSPYYDAQEFNTVTYWMTSGSLPSS